MEHTSMIMIIYSKSEISRKEAVWVMALLCSFQGIVCQFSAQEETESKNNLSSELLSMY